MKFRAAVTLFILYKWGWRRSSVPSWSSSQEAGTHTHTHTKRRREVSLQPHSVKVRQESINMFGANCKVFFSGVEFAFSTTVGGKKKNPQISAADHETSRNNVFNRCVHLCNNNLTTVHLTGRGYVCKYCWVYYYLCRLLCVISLFLMFLLKTVA